ncbi:MAG TPA: hypothetical protein VFZ19_04335 [Solirubrobacterales bacterium]
MKARGPLLLACALVALMAPLAETASAKPGYVVKPKSLSLTVPLPAGNGYSASIETEGHRKVSLEVTKGSFFATYTALGRVTRKGIEADFGDFGQVSLRFEPKSRFTPGGVLAGLPLPASLRLECKGKKSIGERGLFRGSVSFKGERDYTRVAARRLEGKVVRRYKRVCKRRPGATASKDKLRHEGVFYSSQSQRFGVTRYLLGVESTFAFDDEAFASTIAFAGEKRKEGRVGVDKILLVLEELDSIEVSPPRERPLTAELTLPRPFEGTASYLQEGKAPATWTGDFGLRLPGSGLIPLAGPEFEAEICRSDNEEEFDSCLDSVLGSSFLAQGSGSHSQPLALARLSSLR